MSDISREFLDELEKEFNQRYSASKKIQSLVRKLNSSKATSQDAFDYAKEVGNLRKLVLHDLITEDILNDGYLGYYNAKTLFDDVLFKNYELINKYCMNAFTQINKDAGINLKGVSVEYDQEKTDGVVECAVKGRYTETRDETEEAVVTNAKGYYDSSVRKNADTQYKAGLKPKIIRTAVGKTCKWCQSVAGTYDYREVSNKGNDVFRRHANCDCLVVYQPSKGSYQDVHSKQWMDTKEYEEEKIKRIEYSKMKHAKLTPQERIANVKPFLDAKTYQEAKEYADKNLNIQYIFSESVVHIKALNALNEDLTKAYTIFGDLNESKKLNYLVAKKLKNTQAGGYSKISQTIFLDARSVGSKTGMAKMLENAIYQNESGWWSSSNQFHSIRHEIGHAVEHMILDNDYDKKQKISELRAKVMYSFGFSQNEVDSLISKATTPGSILSDIDRNNMKEAGKKLSYYALKDDGEFVAESVAEYLNGDARQISLDVIRILLGE